MTEVFLIARTEPNWPLWLNTASQLLKRSLTSGLDRRGMTPAGPGAFLATLAEFYAQGADPTNLGMFLRHAHASLLCITPQHLLSELPQVCDLKLVAADLEHKTLSLFVASGTLEDWRNATINGTANDYQDIRQFFNKVVQHFELHGLGFVLAGYGRRDRPDGTFGLIKV